MEPSEAHLDQDDDTTLQMCPHQTKANSTVDYSQDFFLFFVASTYLVKRYDMFHSIIEQAGLDLRQHTSVNNLPLS
jgi:hypothetical protein